MNFNPSVSDKQYNEKMEGDGRWKPTVITRKASAVSRAHDGLTGISQLTDLFFKTVQECTSHSIKHSNEIVRSNLSFVSVKLNNPGDKEGWKEVSSYHLPDNGPDITKRLQVTISPQLTQKIIQCREAVLIEKTQVRFQDMPDEMGLSAYIKDTSHEWSLTLTGINHMQTFTLRTDEQEVNI